MTASALRDLAEDPSSRKRFLKLLGGSGAVGAATALLAACGGGRTAVTTTAAAVLHAGDLRIVNDALTLEYVQAAFYRDVIDSGVVRDTRLDDLVKAVHSHEQEHVDALAATATSLGGTPASEPKTSFQDVIGKGPTSIVRAAATIENIGAAAYLWQAPKITSREVLAAMLSIHSVEARHAAALNELAGRGFAGSLPDGPLAKPIDRTAALKALEPFIAG